ncbi:MAG: hypothetical protein FWF96_06255, partial [Kiritimatiellaeota bacterium]|nr:hypothetical protein [Kiritimatiellota bacterium]
MITFPLVPHAPRGVTYADPMAVPPWHNAKCFSAAETPAGFTWDVKPGTFADDGWLTFDFMVDVPDAIVFELRFYAADEEENVCNLLFAGLPYVQARFRFQMCHTDQREWAMGREGACLKRIWGGRALNPAQITKFSLLATRKAPGEIRWWQGHVRYTAREPGLLKNPLLPKGALVDGLGQSTTREWATKTPSFDVMKQRLETQAAETFAWPAKCSKWGGDASRKWDATGFFRTAFEENRWWLVDPDGHPFWSAGMDCVRAHISGYTAGIEAAVPKVFEGQPDIDFLGYNFKRVFGDDWKKTWDAMTPRLLRRFGINTVGNWSDNEMAAAQRFPYVMPLPGFDPKRSGTIFREFPDVFHPGFADDAKDFAKALEPVRDDNALIGYFLMNEPTWGFATQTPVEGMLTLTESAHSRDAFAGWLAKEHADLAAAWDMPGATLEKIRAGAWPVAGFTDAAKKDFEAFGTVMCAKLFDTLSAACKAVAPNHLNLGARYYTVPPRWALLGMANSFDVFSINGYSKKAPEGGAEIARVANKPVLVGEWHFGALDTGLPASGIGHVRDQKARGDAYRWYLEQSAAAPWCVGVHWFTLYDQSAIGRFDGEAYNIGFLDVCNRPYDEICS